jgi:DNA primase
MFKYERWTRANLEVTAEGGETWTCRCPFKKNHPGGDRHPSFRANVAKGLFICHACGEKGNFDQLARRLRVTLSGTAPSASDMIGKIADIRAGQTGEEVKVYPEVWLQQFEHKMGEQYWKERRGLNTATISRFCLGYDKLTHSATIPIRDFHGRVLGVIRRRLDPNATPRYMYPKGFKISDHLWGSFYARGEPAVAVCEGSVDALACWDAGIPAVALLGSRISAKQSHLLLKLGSREIVVMTDRDKAGKEAARQVRASMKGSIVLDGRYRKQWMGKDPADLTKAQRRTMFKTASSL